MAEKAEKGISPNLNSCILSFFSSAIGITLLLKHTLVCQLIIPVGNTLAHCKTICTRSTLEKKRARYYLVGQPHMLLNLCSSVRVKLLARAKLIFLREQPDKKKFCGEPWARNTSTVDITPSLGCRVLTTQLSDDISCRLGRCDTGKSN